MANRAGARSLALPARASVPRAQVPWSVPCDSTVLAHGVTAEGVPGENTEMS